MLMTRRDSKPLRIDHRIRFRSPRLRDQRLRSDHPESDIGLSRLGAGCRRNFPVADDHVKTSPRVSMGTAALRAL